MQKAEPQHKQVQNPSAQRQGKGASLESPQGEQIAQFAAMADASPQSDRLAQLAAMANGSPQAAAQRRMMDMMHNSPRMAAQRKAADVMHHSLRVVAQRQQLDGLAVEDAQEVEEPLQPAVTQRAKAPNNTGLPDNLKSGIESLSGMSMDNVTVHYNSSQPAQLNAHAYAQGTDIHVAPGQEQHLPHEAWHVVQQAQGRVRPTIQMKGDVPVNDDAGLEHEADVMGGKTISGGVAQERSIESDPIDFRAPELIVQRMTNGDDLGRGKRKKISTSDKNYVYSSISGEAKSNAGSAKGRAVECIPGAPTKAFVPPDKTYKNGTTRVHWKGPRGGDDKTSGVEAHFTESYRGTWNKSHQKIRNQLGDRLNKTKTITPQSNGKSKWYAENSHLIAGSLYGSCDSLNAPPASVHQNTEWESIEEGIKILIKEGKKPVIKVTGYLHESGEDKGCLKCARYKIYIDGKKVFDHVADGKRGDIDKQEVSNLTRSVRELTKDSTEISSFGKPPNGLGDTTRPTESEIKKSSLASVDVNNTRTVSSPMFTDVLVKYLTGERRLTSGEAIDKVHELMDFEKNDSQSDEKKRKRNTGGGRTTKKNKK